MLNAFSSPCDGTVLQFLRVEHECGDSTWFSSVKCLLFCTVWLKTIDLLKAVVSCTVKYLQTVWSLLVKCTLSLFNFFNSLELQPYCRSWQESSDLMLFMHYVSMWFHGRFWLCAKQQVLRGEMSGSVGRNCWPDIHGTCFGHFYIIVILVLSHGHNTY